MRFVLAIIAILALVVDGQIPPQGANSGAVGRNGRTGVPGPPGTPNGQPEEDDKQTQEPTDHDMLKLMKKVNQIYEDRATCGCTNWPKGFNSTCHYLADFSKAGDYVAPTNGLGVSWKTRVSGTEACKSKGVLKMIPPSWATELTIDICMKNPEGWSFHVGDSPSNDGFGGDYGDTWNYAEVHSNNKDVFVYRAFDGMNRDRLLMNVVENSVGSGPFSIKIYRDKGEDRRLDINNYEGVKMTAMDKLLFAWDATYMGIGQVINGVYRTGSGVCFVCVRWS